MKTTKSCEPAHVAGFNGCQLCMARTACAAKGQHSGFNSLACTTHQLHLKKHGRESNPERCPSQPVLNGTCLCRVVGTRASQVRFLAAQACAQKRVLNQGARLFDTAVSLIAVKELNVFLTRLAALWCETANLVKEPLGSSTRLAASHHKAANLVKEALGSLTRRKRMAVHTTIVTSWKELVTMAVCTATGFCLIKEPGGSLIRWAASYHEAVNLIKEPPGSLTRRQCTCCKSS